MAAGFVDETRRFHSLRVGNGNWLHWAAGNRRKNQFLPSWSRRATWSPSVMSRPFFPSSNSTADSIDHHVPSSQTMPQAGMEYPVGEQMTGNRQRQLLSTGDYTQNASWRSMSDIAMSRIWVRVTGSDDLGSGLFGHYF